MYHAGKHIIYSHVQICYLTILFTVQTTTIHCIALLTIQRNFCEIQTKILQKYLVGIYYKYFSLRFMLGVHFIFINSSLLHHVEDVVSPRNKTASKVQLPSTKKRKKKTEMHHNTKCK